MPQKQINHSALIVRLKSRECDKWLSQPYGTQISFRLKQIMFVILRIDGNKNPVVECSLQFARSKVRSFGFYGVRI